MTRKRSAIEKKKYSQKEIEDIMKEMQNNPYYKKWQKTKIPVCLICGKKYKKVKPYLWRGCCKHIPRNLILAVG